ncbi:hypothetical protein Glove_170g35 [Diversispora epigaea]|uniref:Uncharacterized protein n=1 Tax=Diversispora epigaea TaxID=1348612 RepID=A0A397IXM9_9GLOM|nr:hypothetical protein Glove_170g35 [Diversispora epigaea]
MGHNKAEINKQLLTGITFCPFYCLYENLWLFIFGIGISDEEQYFYISTGFKSSFNYMIGTKKKTLFLQEINKKKFSVKLYQNFKLKSTFIDDTSIQWHEFFLEWYNEQKTIIELIVTLKKLYPLNYTFNNRKMRAWRTIPLIMGHNKAEINKQLLTGITFCPFYCLYENLWLFIFGIGISDEEQYFYITSIQWHEFFLEWYNEQKTIIELIVTLKKLYPLNYTFNNRKMRAWRTMLSHAGCTDITPFTKETSNAHVIMSSYKTDTKTGQLKKFKESFSNGLKRTTFYTKLMRHQYIYREDLGGLCVICSTYGYETFEDIINLVKKKINNTELQDMTNHNLCINHYLLYAFGECNTIHTYTCIECQELFQFFQDLKINLNISYYEEILEYQNRILYYLVHQTCKIYLNTQFNAVLLALDKEGAILVVDYKIKILFKIARETKQEFFEKKGWFSASSLYLAIENLETKSKWIYIISDNGPHYYNSELMVILNKWFEWYKIQISLSIKRYIQIGRKIQEGNNITSAVKDIAGTLVAHIELNRNKENNKGKMIPGKINQPLTQLSELTKSKSLWKIPVLHALGICSKRLPLQELTNELRNRGVDYGNQNKRQKLVEILNKELIKEILKNKEKKLKIDYFIFYKLLNNNEFPLSSGWATKEVQKYEKKGGGK